MNILQVKKACAFSILSLSVLAAGGAFAKTENANLQACVTDFNTTQRVARSGLSSEQIGQLENIAAQTLSEPDNAQNLVEQGWGLLASWGDVYGGNAKQIIMDKPDTPNGIRNHNIVRDHWGNTVGYKKYNLFFHKVAAQHFRQYVQMLKNGNWPDSDQVVNSYLTALRINQLPDSASIDAVWLVSGPESFPAYRWEKIIGLTSDRWVLPSHVCSDMTVTDAMGILIEDLLGLI